MKEEGWAVLTLAHIMFIYKPISCPEPVNLTSKVWSAFQLQAMSKSLWVI